VQHEQARPDGHSIHERRPDPAHLRHRQGRRVLPGLSRLQVDWDHRFDDNSPLYRQAPRGDLVLHLSEHHGDGSPGARLRVMMRGVEEFHREISAKAYRYMRPDLEQTPWGTLETGAIDPFGNLIRFCEPIDKHEPSR
jgi:Glyoxalase superfamily protein